MRTILMLVAVCTFLACYKNKDDYNTGDNNSGNTNCGSHDGHTLYKDDQGCYYYNDNYYSTKVYVELSECKCP